MSRINTNIQSLVAQRVFNTQTQTYNTSLNRLSTGYRINSGKDDPAGLIASEALRAEKAAINATLGNISRANSVIATAEGGLVEINKLLTELEDLLDRSSNEAGLTESERDANQLQIDTILQSIDRIANSTEFLGKKLLSGEMAYTTSGVAGNSLLDNVRVNAAKVPNDGYRSVTIDVAGSAQVGTISYTGSSVSGGTATIEVAGSLGTEVYTFGSGTSIQQIATAVNQNTELTGVSAWVSGGGALIFNSTEYGADEFVSVREIDTLGIFSVTSGDAGDGKDYGQDANVRINGVTAVTDGLRATVRSEGLSIDVDLSATFGTLGGASSTSFAITGGGADFMISPTISLSGLASMAFHSASTGSLGSAEVGYLTELRTGSSKALDSGNFAEAQQILRAAQEYVATLRGQLGAFQKDTLDTTYNNLLIAHENVSAAESVIRETEFASETSNLTRAQILQQSAMNTLRMANAAPQSALALLG